MINITFYKQNFMISFIERISGSKNNTFQSASLLLDLLKVEVTNITLRKELEEHPYYPSLLSINDVFNAYGVETLVASFHPNKLHNLPIPFITQIQNNNNTYLTVVKNIKNGNICFYNPKKQKWDTCFLQTFLESYSGIVLLTEVSVNAGEKGYPKKRKAEIINEYIQNVIALFLPVIALLVGIVAILQKGKLALFPFVFSIFTIAGFFISMSLLWYEFDQHNPLLNQICHAGKKINCNAVLNSNASKIAGISWSAIGFSYFTGIMLLLLLFGITEPLNLFTIAWLNTFSIFYIFFSIYYQWKIIKQWCLFCLSIQGILVFQLFISTIAGWHNLIFLHSLSLTWGIQLLIIFSIPLLSIIIISQLLIKAKEGNNYRTEFQRLKHSSQIFEALLSKQKKINAPPDSLGIILGNPNSDVKIIKVCNPYCNPCSKAHKPIEELLSVFNNLQVQILFTATKDEKDKRSHPVKHLLAIAEKNNQEITKQALNDWYLGKKNYSNFSELYPITDELKNQENKIEAMNQWCKRISIDFTPTFFISIPNLTEETSKYFYQLPNMYSIKDLKYILSPEY